MKAHLKYLRYVLKHKWFVLQECLKLGLPLWVGLVHDWQKFTPTEWQPYVLSFYGPWPYKERPAWLVEQFNRAWLHHIHCGPHHWQHWLLTMDEAKEGDSGMVVLKMPDRYTREMLADWRGAGRAITGQDNTREWYLQRRDRFKRVLHPETRQWIESQLEVSDETQP